MFSFSAQNPQKNRFVAYFFVAASLIAAGHHLIIVASSGAAVTTSTVHHNLEVSPEHERGDPVVTVEAHTLTPIIQKFQLQKHFSVSADLVRTSAFVQSPTYLESRITARADEPKARVPLDQKTVFLN